MGAKLAHPEKTCVNVMGDASIGMVGLDIETAVRNPIGILTIVFNNGVMAGEQNSMQAEVKRYHAADLGGNYSEVARALGGWSVRVSEPDLFRPALDQAPGRSRADQGLWDYDQSGVSLISESREPGGAGWA